MAIKTIEPAKGRLLVSIPFLNDQFFSRSVVLLTEHNEDGSVGFILNKPLETTITEAISDFPDFEAVLHVGGPVDSSSLFYVHTLGDIIPESLPVLDGLYWGGDFDVIKTLIRKRQIKPSEIKFFVGYSGWASEQLDREIRERSWVVQKSTTRIIMKQSSEEYWKYFIKKTDREYAVWADFPVNPSLN
ncbi:MAG TPA: YqgE/AlgH family protein [Bacteroidia bacterium]|nr:YqgE/AlgH family protein [Sphingobacteriales bacterium]HPD64970.1 YqgE/AlgH family protein [Bacteroidia bacterium]HRS58156.1 YqgE/AlgH family protein [Bacteroidia bacterium]HRU67486.1 YqgE/AlgH family protein [Bacteroidia bacterium]